MRKALRTLKGDTGRVLRDIARKFDAVPEGRLPRQMEERMALVTRLLRQTPKSAGKLYALHEPEVDCISKGKARALRVRRCQRRLNSGSPALSVLPVVVSGRSEHIGGTLILR